MKKENVSFDNDANKTSAPSTGRTSSRNSGFVPKDPHTQSPGFSGPLVETVNKKTQPHDSQQLELPQLAFTYVKPQEGKSEADMGPGQTDFCPVNDRTPVLTSHEKHASWMNFKKKFIGKKILLREN